MSFYLDTEISTDGSGCGILWVGLAEHDTSGLDDVQAFPDHGHDGAAGHVLAEAGVERLARQVSVVLLQEILRSLQEFRKLKNNKITAAKTKVPFN
jgi:hypothetical protein